MRIFILEDDKERIAAFASMFGQHITVFTNNVVLARSILTYSKFDCIFLDHDLEGKQMAEGLTLRAVAGDHTMLTFVEFQPHAVLPVHQHPHEQITFLLAGELEFTLERETRILGKGEGVIVRSQAQHGARALNKPAKVLDVWYPRREDYL